MYMLGRRRTCSRPSRTWICSAVYATSAPRARGLPRDTVRPAGNPREGVFEPPLPGKRPSQRGEVMRKNWAELQAPKSTGFEYENGPLGALTGAFLKGFLTGCFRRFGGSLPAQDGVLAHALQI